MNHFDAIIFDMDGLLLDSEQIALVAFNEALDLFGLESETKLFFKTIGTNAQSCKNILREGLKGKADPDKFGKLWFEKYTAKTLETTIPLKEGATELLEHINKIGLTSAVATSTETGMAKKNWKDQEYLIILK